MGMPHTSPQPPQPHRDPAARSGWRSPRYAPLAFVMGAVVLALTLTVIVNKGAMTSTPAHRQAAAHVAALSHHARLALDIFPIRPLGPTDNWPAYTPSTDLSVPADSDVTVTIRNFDLGPAPLPAVSPYANVSGTVSGSASADGHPYTALDWAHVAHTFTISQLGINVPIPADAAPGQSFVTVSFTFHVGAAGTYHWRCNAPCGTEGGYQGPMQTQGYMTGTLTVHG